MTHGSKYTHATTYHGLLFPTVLHLCVLVSFVLGPLFHRQLFRLVSWLDKGIAAQGLNFHLRGVGMCNYFLLSLLILL
jgi:hypothetical protein